MTVKAGVTLEIREGVSVFEGVVNNGTVKNGGVIRGSIGGEGEVLTLVRAEPEPASLDVSVTDKSGRAYEGEPGTKDFYLPAGDYTFAFSGEGYYSAAVNVSVTPERYQIVRQSVDPKLSFSDVDSSDWFYEYVFTAYSKGLMQGITETSFAPAARSPELWPRPSSTAWRASRRCRTATGAIPTQTSRAPRGTPRPCTGRGRATS